MAGFDKEMWEDFVVEVQENLEEFEPNLLLLEQHPDDRSILNDCFRNMHSIKGAANYMGFSKMAELAHKIENIMDMARQGEASLDQSTFDVIFKAVDLFRTLLSDIEKNQKETLDTSWLINEIDSLNGKQSDMQGRETKGQASSNDSCSVASEGTNDVVVAGADEEEEEDSELLTIFQEEIKSLYHQLMSVCAKSDGSVSAMSSILEDMERVTNYMGQEELLKSIRGVRTTFCSDAEATLGEEERQRILKELEEAFKSYVEVDLSDKPSFNTPSATDFEEDQELYEIFLDFFKETGGPLAAIPEEFKQEWLFICQDAIEKLKTSANYMDYMEVVRILEEWEERFAEVETNPDMYNSSMFHELWLQLETALPGLSEIFSQEIEAPEASASDEAEDIQVDTPVLDPNDLDLLDSAIDSLMEVSQEEVAASSQSDEKDSTDPVQAQAPDPSCECQSATQVSESVRRFLEASSPKTTASTKTVRVNLEKVEHLLEDVAELVVLRSSMAQDKSHLENLYSKCADERLLPTEQLRQLKEILLGFTEKVSALERIVNQLQDGVMRIRMLPVSHLFNRFPRMVRDISKKLAKDVELVISGAETALDKQIMEQLADPLQHIIRNAVDHGIESPEERKRFGKPAKGRLAIAASQEGNFVVISVSDDGKGLDRDEIVKKASRLGLISPDKIASLSENQIYQLIFAPGFSTAGEVSDLSGRGVGLDVVKKNVERAGGSVVVRSVKGQGTTIFLRIPLTLAIVRGLIVKVGQQAMVIPVASVFETFRISSSDISQIEGYEIISRRQETLPLIRLGSIFRGTGADNNQEKFFGVRVRAGDIEACLGVDALVGQQEVVIKPLSDYLMDQPGFAGATILGDGSIALILDLSAVLEKSKGFIYKRQRILEQQALGADLGAGHLLH